MSRFMERALELAILAAKDGEVPVGTVVVKKSTNEIIGEGKNCRESRKNALAHAEIIAIDEACRKLRSWRLLNCAIYITLEPCLMCYGAIINSRIDDVYFGAYDLKNWSPESISIQRMLSYSYNHRLKINGGIMENECHNMLSVFFKRLRNKKI